MTTQLGLPIQERLRKSLETAAKEIRACCRLIAKKGKQEALARAARMDPGNFSKALAGDTYKLDLDMLPVFFAEDEDRLLIQLLCHLCGGQFVEQRRLTPEEREAIYRRAVEAAAPVVAEFARKAVEAEERAL